jgi:hypothetical protein
LREWVHGVEALDPAPDEVILSTDVSKFIPEVNSICHRMDGGWKYPQAYHLTKALGHVMTDWVWIHDIDDLAFPDALEGLDEIEADVFQMGYLRSDGAVHIPSELVEEGKNQLVAGSCVRTRTLRAVGGFPDCAFQDWALWMKLASRGATFAFSERPRFHYRRHAQARGERELTTASRAQNMAEMEKCLAVT